ncbi:MAG: hypothetical protein GY941_08205, partial [Planctomycetes bacterium]|nr:hypothetical protein [Planctomycetota bacterium]
MDRKELDALIGELSDYLNEKIESEIEIRFVGGSAVCLYGGGTTLDVDFDFSSDK